MFERQAEKELVKWAESKYRKPLVLRGARQVGKTTIVNRFSGRFENFLSVNLEKKDAKLLFESTDDVRKLLPMLFLYCNKEKTAGKILLFIDEIQTSPHTVALLRYFYEELPEIYVIAAGSLLETMLDKHISIPVGRVEYMALHPCSFSEFLSATNNRRFEELRLSDSSLPEVFHNELNRLFNAYALMGGMPEVVACYAQENDISVLRKIYDNLLNAYKNDVEKYAAKSTQVAVIRHILEEGWAFSGEAITLGSFAGSSYKSREVGEAFRTLQKALLLELVYPTNSVQMPLVSELKRAPKLCWLDVGLVNFASGIQKEYLLSKDLHDSWRGKAAEQIVAQELKALNNEVGSKRHFWLRNKKGSSSEVDFVYVHEGNIVPVEVKNGHNAHLKSLHQFMSECNHDVAVRVWSGNYSVDEVRTISGKYFRLINLPFYMIGNLQLVLSRFL